MKKKTFLQIKAQFQKKKLKMKGLKKTNVFC